MVDYSKQLSHIIGELSAEDSLRGLFQQHLEGNPLPSARAVYEIVKLSRAIIFPGYFGKSKINRHTVSYHIGLQVEQLFELLTDQIAAALCFQSADNEHHARTTVSTQHNRTLKLKGSPATAAAAVAAAAATGTESGSTAASVNSDCGCNVPDCECSESQVGEQGKQCLSCDDEVKELARSLAIQYIESLGELRASLALDVRAAFNGDPAATSFGEVICCYPGLRAVSNYRMAHRLLTLGVPLIPRAITELAHSETGIDIHPGARIGESFAIDHGTGVVIGETCIIGNNVKIYQGVTLGAKSIPVDNEGMPLNIPRHPILEDDVVVYSNASILGRITIGKGAIIGGNVWVIEDVPAGGRVVQQRADR